MHILYTLLAYNYTRHINTYQHLVHMIYTRYLVPGTAAVHTSYKMSFTLSSGRSCHNTSPADTAVVLTATYRLTRYQVPDTGNTRYRQYIPGTGITRDQVPALPGIYKETAIPATGNNTTRYRRFIPVQKALADGTLAPWRTPNTKTSIPCLRRPWRVKIRPSTDIYNWLKRRHIFSYCARSNYSSTFIFASCAR